MTRLSLEARLQLASLLDYYEIKERPEAIRNLRTAAIRAVDQIKAGRRPIYDAPRPYPALSHLGLRWIVQGGYWFAFRAEGAEFVMVALYHVSANIPRRAAGLSLPPAR